MGRYLHQLYPIKSSERNYHLLCIFSILALLVCYRMIILKTSIFKKQAYHKNISDRETLLNFIAIKHYEYSSTKAALFTICSAGRLLKY